MIEDIKKMWHDFGIIEAKVDADAEAYNAYKEIVFIVGNLISIVEELESNAANILDNINELKDIISGSKHYDDELDDVLLEELDEKELDQIEELNNMED